jgi:hypothetical protein
MPAPLWQQPARDFLILAQPARGFWTLIIDYVAPGASLKFVVENHAAMGVAPPRWYYTPEYTCTADGDPLGVLRAEACLISTASPGALIGKVGGSCAGRAEDGKVFIVGSYCIYTLDADTSGPLYLTMNFEPFRSIARSGAIKVQVSVG